MSSVPFFVNWHNESRVRYCAVAAGFRSAFLQRVVPCPCVVHPDVLEISSLSDRPLATYLRCLVDILESGHIYWS